MKETNQTTTNWWINKELMDQPQGSLISLFHVFQVKITKNHSLIEKFKLKNEIEISNYI